MLKKGNVIMIFLFICISILLTPFFAGVYANISGTPSGSYGSLADIGFSHPEYFIGFFLSSSLFVTLGIIIFAGKSRYLIFAIVTGLEFLLLLITLSFGPLIVDSCAATIAIILGESILFINRKITAKK